MRRILLLALALTSPIADAQQRNLVAAGEQRVALVIGNAAYKESPLRNPVNDARAMADRLQRLGFTVIRRENLKSREIGTALNEFRSRLAAGSVAVFFYAGHGLQVRGQNYLPAVDAEISSELDVPNQSLNMTQVLELLDDAKTRVNLVFLDACRDNPFARRFRSASRGLAKVDAASGTLISFATRPGSVAADGDGQNGLYTEHLLKHMDIPGLAVEQMLKRVGSGVKLASKGRQEPWSEGLIEGDFYFRGAAPSTAPAASVMDPAALDLAAWESVKDSGSAEELKAYLEQYPSGRFAGIARARLKGFDPEPTPPARPTPAPQVATVAPQASVSAGAHAANAFRDCDACPVMISIPAGNFMMGSEESEPDRTRREGPRHRVTIARSLAIAKFETNFDEWDACVRERGCRHEAFDDTWGRGKQPAINVSWHDAGEYVAWLSKKTGKHYRLPSEAEWEYAARAGTTTAFAFGEKINARQARFTDSMRIVATVTSTMAGRSVPVGTYQANAFGLHDMHGNVWEWVQDCHNAIYRGAPTDGSAWLVGSCPIRVVRGGGWNNRAPFLRSASRHYDNANARRNNIGFRVVRD